MSLKKVKLNYKPVASRRSTEIAFTISSEHVNAVDRNIQRKIKRNLLERQYSYLDASNYTVKSSGPKLILKR